MSIFDDARTATGSDENDGDTREVGPSGTTGRRNGVERTQVRGATVEIEGDTVSIEEPDTTQPRSEGASVFTSQNLRGVPRGVGALKQRRIAQTAAFQSIANGITDQLLGGDLAFIDDDMVDDLSPGEQEAADDLKGIVRDVLEGPHMGDEDLDDLVAAAVEDMLGPGNAYWQLLRPESADIPVVGLTTLDPLTVRHNVSETGMPKDPPYLQSDAAFGQGASGAVRTSEMVELDSDDLAVLRYPKGHRSYRTYPVSAAWQVKEWLEILTDSTTHHKRYYSDNEVPPGLLQIVEASDTTVDDIKNQVEQASGDPRDFPIVGGEAPAQWIEMGGTSINLNVIEEQKWFMQMALGALGLGKQEIGLIEDVNRSNGEVEAERVFKRVAGPFGKQFERAFVEVARQFDAYGELGEPFTPTLAFTDPRAERAKQERLREEYQAGKLTLREYRRRAGDQDIAEDGDAFTVDVGGVSVDYGDHPKWVAKRLLANAGATDPDAGGGGDDTDDSEQAVDGEFFLTRDADDPPFTDYPEAAVENAQMALDAREDTGDPNDCGTDTGWARANQLADREPVSEETVRRMAAFRRHQDNAEMDDEEGRADCGWMMWKAWGGEEGVSWAERKVEEFDDEDD
jgi:hypothetical protein